MSTQTTIKILFLVANPHELTRLQIDEEMRAIDQALRMTQYSERFDLRSHWAVRYGDLQELLLRYQPHIVHFSGHGNPVGEIILQSDQGVHAVSTEALSTLFSILKDNLRCVVLSSCYSEAQAQAIAEHIDCVIGMSDAIGDTASINFAVAFYRALGYGRSVKEAFDLGCSEINLANLPDIAIPRLLAFKREPSSIVMVQWRAATLVDSHTIFIDLSNIMAELYPDEANIRRIAADADLNSQYVSLSTHSTNSWHAILTEAEKTGKLNTLFAVVLGEHGSNEELRKACNAYRRNVESKPELKHENAEPQRSDKRKSSKDPSSDAKLYVESPSLGKDTYIIKGTSISKYAVKDKLVVYGEIIPGTEVAIALLQVTALNPNSLLAQAILVHPGLKILGRLRVDDRLRYLSTSELVPAVDYAMGYLLREGSIRLRPNNRIEENTSLVVLEPQIVDGVIIDHLETSTTMRVKSIGQRAAVAEVELVTKDNEKNGEWPPVGTILKQQPNKSPKSRLRARALPNWFPIAGAIFLFVTIAFLMFIFMQRDKLEDGREFILILIAAFSGGGSVFFLGGWAKAEGTISIPGIPHSPISFGVTSGLAGFLIVLVTATVMFRLVVPRDFISPMLPIEATDPSLTPSATLASFSTPTIISAPQQVNYIGRIIDADTEATIRGAKVSLEFQGAPPIVYTDSEGIFRFAVKVADSGLAGRVKVEAPGYALYDRFVELSSTRTSIEDIRLTNFVTPTPISTEPAIALLCPIVKSRTYLIGIGDFYTKGDAEFDAVVQINESLDKILLQSDFEDSVQIERCAQVIAYKDQARQIGQTIQASLMIWGRVSGSSLEVNFEVIGQEPQIAPTVKRFFSSPETLDRYHFLSETAPQFRGFVAHLAAFILGEYLYKQKRYPDSIAMLSRTVEIAQGLEVEGLDGAYLLLGNAKQSNDDAIGALESYSRAIELNPQLIQAYYNRATTNFTFFFKLEEAQADLDILLKLDNSYAKGYNLRGVIANVLALGNSNKPETQQDYWKQALKDFSAALDLLPLEEAQQAFDIYNNRGSVLGRLGNFAAAKADLTHTLGSNLDCDPIFAEDSFTAAPEMARDLCAQAAANLAENHLRDVNGDYGEAVKLAQLAFENASDNTVRAGTYLTMGKAYAKLGRHEEACEALNQALSLLPSNYPNKEQLTQGICDDR